MWHIWLARNAEVWQNKPEGLEGTKARIWHEMKLYLKSEWQKSYTGDSLQTNIVDRLHSFRFDTVYEVVDQKIITCRIRRSQIRRPHSFG